MTLAGVLSLYLCANILIGITFVALLALRHFNSPGAELRIHYRALAFLPIGMGLSYLLPKPAFFEPFARVWSGPSLKGFEVSHSGHATSGWLSVTAGAGFSSVPMDLMTAVCGGIALLATIYGLAIFVRDMRALRRIQKASFLMRKIGNVAVYVNERIRVPFSFFLPFQNAVVVPSRLVGTPEMRLVVLHELQHHRQGDTRWIYAVQFLRLIFGMNPFVHLWARLLTEVQEFACDEALVDHKGVSSLAYARCLIQVAETAVGMKEGMVCATGLSFMTDRQTLKRRVERMLKPKTKTRSIRKLAACAPIVALVAYSGMAWASQNWIQDRRVTVEAAQAMVVNAHANAKASSGIPLVVNDLVLKELNRYVGTPEGREFMRNALARMETYRPLISAKLREYKIPEELAAIPIIESGYQNLAETGKPSWGAGLWMFIKSTARNYGLRVDESVDERMNVELETDAAMRYLSSNKNLFNDWSLAVYAYNIGEQRLRKAIQDVGSRDIWKIVRAGYQNDRGYYARLVAAILIMKNPSALD